MDDRPAALPAQPRPGPQLRQVPRAHRRHASSRRPRPATDVTFWLSAPQPDVVHDRRRRPRSRRSAPRPTRRSSSRRPRTCRSSRASLAAARLDDRRQDAPRPLAAARRRAPASTASRRCRSPATRCTSGCPRRCRRTRSASASSADIEGVGVDPTNPPLAWEAWTGDDWDAVRARLATRPAGSTATATWSSTCPRGHARRSIAKQRAGWLRARVDRARRGPARLQRLARHQGPRRRSRSAAPSTRSTPSSSTTRTLGDLRGRARASASRSSARPVVPGDDARRPRGRRRRGLGRVDPGRRLRRPAAPTTRTSRSTCRRARSGSGRRSGWPTARCAATARCPPKGARLRLREYRTGGGRRGQRRAAALISVLKSSIPFVARVENRRAGARRRRRRGHRERQGPRPDPAAHPRPRRDHRGLRAARPRGRARGRPRPGRGGRRRRRRRVGAGPGRAVGRAARPGGCGSTSSSRPRTRSRRSPTGSRRAASSARGSIVEPPVYRGVTVVARSSGRGRASTRPGSRRRRSLALYEYFHPITGGPDGTGWPFGRPVNVGRDLLGAPGAPRAPSWSRTPGCSAPTR